MITYFGITSLLVTLIVLYVTRFYYRYFTRTNPLPGPFPLPLIGNVHQSFGMGFNNWLTLVHKKYGDMFEVYLANERNIFLCRADLIEKLNIPATKSNFFQRFRDAEAFVEYELYAAGIGSNNDYESWKYNRHFFDQAMLTPTFNDQAVEWVNELCKEMETCWVNLGENQVLDLNKWMHRFTNEIIFKITTGIKNNSVTAHYNFILESNKTLKGKKGKLVDESDKFVNSIQTYIGGLVYITNFNNFMLHYVPFIRGKWKAFMKNKEYLFGVLEKVIEDKKLEIENTPLDQPLGTDLLTSYLTANTPRDVNPVKRPRADLTRPMTYKEIRSIVLDSMLGGTETTATLFCYIVYYLGRYPEVKQKVRQELDAVLGKDLTKPVTYKDLEELQYCEAVINEVNRHCPVSFIMSRINSERDNVGGYDWPEGTLFQMLYSAIMKHKDNWTEPEKFDPDRFYKVEESDKFLLEKRKAKNVYPIFGGGIRICPGKKLAMVELKSLVAYFRKYDIVTVDDAPLKLKSDFINHIDEFLVRVKPRKF